MPGVVDKIFDSGGAVHNALAPPTGIKGDGTIQ